MACEKGIIKIFNPARNSIVANFDIEQEIKEYQRKERGDNDDNHDEDEIHVGDIIEVVKTFDVEKTNEYMVLAREGLFFIQIKQVKKPGNGGFQFEFKFNQDEQYFKSQTVKGAFEYDSKKIIALVNGEKSIKFINRVSQKEEKHLTIANLNKETEYRCLLPFPYYNYQTFPYILVKDSKSLNVINVRTMQSRVIVRNSPCGWDILRTSVMDFMEPDRPEGGGDISVTLFNLELESRQIPNSRVRDNTSSIKKFTINPENLDSCFL